MVRRIREIWPAREHSHHLRPLASAVWLCLVAWIALTPSASLADVGAVRASKRHDGRQITVFTDPTPLRAGPIDVGVLVLDDNRGKPVLDADIQIEVMPADPAGKPLRYQATRAGATNKLFHAGHFDLPASGLWHFTVRVGRPRGNAVICFEAEADPPSPAWRSLWPWFTWPFFVVAWFATARICLASRERRSLRVYTPTRRTKNGRLGVVS